MPFAFLFFFMLTTNAVADGVETAVSITQKECKKILRLHRFSSADYEPGVDAHGGKVTGADLNTNQRIKVPNEITFDIGVDLAERYDLPSGFYGKGSIGKITIKSRDVYWNDQKLGTSENEAIVEACKAQYSQN